MVIFMNRKEKTIVVFLVVMFLTLIYTLASTYAVIINVRENEGLREIVNQITIRDLVINDDGNYNNTYYTVKNELNITSEEAELIMDSVRLNENLQLVLNSVVEYKLDNNKEVRLTDNEIYNLILDGVYNTDTFSDELKNKIINKSNIYKDDVSEFLYDIDVNLIG